MSVRVACAARGGYVEKSGALLHSVIRHGGGDAVVDYLHAADLEPDQRHRLERVTGGAIVFHEVGEARVAGLPVRDYFTSAMWYRLLLPELVDAPRVIYVDVDTLVLDDLDELWATDLEGRALGAVANVFQRDHLFHADDLGIAPGHYFNSGVLLLDLDVWRRDGLADRVRQVAHERAGQRGWPDQDALNLALRDAWTPLHPRWNAMNALYGNPDADALFGAERVAEACARPGIRHFEGPAQNKPWEHGAQPPGAEAWRQAFTASRQV